jgi:hypothetical protein
MSLTDRVTIAIELHKDGSKMDGGNEALNALVASIPVAGGPLSSLLAGRAQRKMLERVTDVLEALKERLEQTEDSKVDRAFFESDEFLTLFTLTLEQIQTTHDKNKLNMLATGLANSAHVDFASESRKELLLRILRDLAPEHVSMLQEMKPVEHLGKQVGRVIDSPVGDDLAVLQHLAAQGLVTERLEMEPFPNMNPSHPSAFGTIRQLLEIPPAKTYVISDFGVQFLNFFETERANQADVATARAL